MPVGLAPRATQVPHDTVWICERVPDGYRGAALKGVSVWQGHAEGFRYVVRWEIPEVRSNLTWH